jgi:hypothetical protein
VQNAVVFERSTCTDKPADPDRMGNTKNDTKARILPPRVTVIEGLIITSPIKTSAMIMIAISMGVGPNIEASFGSPGHPLGERDPKSSIVLLQIAFATAWQISLMLHSKHKRPSLTAEFADVRYKRLARVGAERLLVSGHLPLAFGDDREELSIGLALYFGGAQIAGL